MSRIVILFHSGYGHTTKIAQAVADGSGGALMAIDAEGKLPAGGWAKRVAASSVLIGTAACLFTAAFWLIILP